MNPATSRDPYLDLPLEGVRLIEASAGTGKTFTVATLFTRLVVERGLRIGQVLAVTFTEAATQELRRRIRERLALALQLVPADDAAAAPPEGPDARLTAELLQAHLARSNEPAASLRRRLQQAVEEIDLAAIFTIHGFCARVLREYALESGQSLASPQLLANDHELLAEAAADLWRARAADPAMADDLMALWPGGPDALARDLGDLVRHPRLLPAAMADSPDPRPARQLAGEALRAAVAEHADEAYAAIGAAFDSKVFDGRRARRPSFDRAFELLWQGSVEAHWALDGSHLEKLLPARLRDVCKDDTRHRAPCSPLFDALEAWQHADLQVRQWELQRRLRLLHALRQDAIARLALLKRHRRLQTYDDLVDGVANALQGPHAEALAQRLRAQYAIALVDEFQDTDDRQWSIFSSVFGEGGIARAAGLAPALLLIGDPKQAIYGFRGGDVRTYLLAAAMAERAPALAHNFRSRPGVLAAIDALYAQAGYAQAFRTEGIAFHPVQPGPGRADADLQRDGAIAPALTLWQAPAPGMNDKGKPKPFNAGPSADLCTRACVAAIHGWLEAGQAGTATLAGRPVQAGDIAVLVRDHRQASRIRLALGAAGIAAVAAGRASLFATAEAGELLALLQALIDPGDDARLRAALATVLVGEDAAAIAALEADGDRHRQWQQRALDWRERWRRGGPLALVSDLGAEHGPRLLALFDGERRLTNYLQLAELLQEADARALGPHGLVDWLARRIANADDNDEAQQLRLESDAHRVQIVTLHKSKGLEYPLVFLPYVGIGRRERGPGSHCVVHAAGARYLHWNTGRDDPDWSAAEAAWREEQRAEDARLLYVGLTRAAHALWVATGCFHGHDRTALHAMVADVAALQASAGGALEIDARPPPANLPRLPAARESLVPDARVPQRHIAPDWWVYSFTQLANADAGIGADPMASATVESSGGSDEPASAEAVVPAELEPFDPRFAGNRFGVVMHEVLEACDFAAWQHWRPGQPAPEGQATPIVECLQRGGYAQDTLADGLAMLTALVGQTLTVRLPEGSQLAGVPASARRNEMEFHFAMRPTRVEALLSLLHRHGLLQERHAFGARQRLEGLMTGLIDLTYQHEGRWYVLDYKSNRLPGYDIAAMTRAMAHSEYELQALIYTVALHRWLRFRLGGDYRYARDFGGVRYLFCRGLDATRDPSPGVQAWRFEPALVEALDALFAGHALPEAMHEPA